MPQQIPLRNKAPDPAARPMAEAISHHQAGRLADAERLYRIAIGLVPDHGDALRLLGTLYLQIQKPEQALPLLRGALKSQPKNPEILNNLAIALRDTGNREEAKQLLEEALAINPNYVDALNNFGTVLQALDQPDKAIPLYEKALQLRPDYGTAMGNLASALCAVGQYERGIEFYKQASRLLPKEIKYLVEQGLAYRRLGKLEDAFAFLQRGMLLNQGDPLILSYMGHVLREMGRIDSAIDCYNRSLQGMPNNPDVYMNLAACWWEKNNLPIAIHCYELALGQNPDFIPAKLNLGAAMWGAGRREEGRQKLHEVLRVEPDNLGALINLGITYHDEGRPDEALPYFDKALHIDPDNEMAKWRKSFVLLALGDYRKGWELYEAGLGDHHKRGLRLFPEPAWDGSPMPDKHLLIWSEQGFGDSLQFIRYAAEARHRVGKISVLCPKPLVSLFQSLPYVDEAFDQMDANRKFDAHIPMMSLPYRFGTTLETVPANMPYLSVAPEVQEKWSRRFQNVSGFKIGLVWGGSAREGQINSGQIDQRRSIGLDRLKPFLDMPGAVFYNLQMGAHAQQIAELGLENRMIDLIPDVSDFSDTAAILQNLDLVLTVDTSVAHLAGGLGKPVWILSRFDACWRWLKNKPTSPWYPTARIFGQPTPGDWDSVIHDVQRELALLLSKEA